MSVAGAAAPEFGRCVKLAGEKVGKNTVYHGAYAIATCVKTSETHTGKWEWEPGVVKAGFKTTSKPATAIVLEGSGTRTKVTCKTESGSGLVTGAKTVGSVAMKFTGCESFGGKCTKPGLAEGELEASALEGELGWPSKTPQAVALALFPVGKTGTFMVINCAHIISVRGAVLVKITPNRMFSSTVLLYMERLGEQRLTHFEGGVRQVLSFVEPEELEQEAGLDLMTTLATEEAMEISAVV